MYLMRVVVLLRICRQSSLSHRHICNCNSSYSLHNNKLISNQQINLAFHMNDARGYYIIWLVSSSVSCLVSLLVVLNVALVPKLWGQFFQQLIFGLALFDILQSSSWFLGPKYSSSFYICSRQEYMLEAGSLCKAFLTVVICGVSMHILYTFQPPTTTQILKLSCLALVCALAAITILVSFRAAELYCESDIFKSDNNQNALYAYIFAFLVPLYSCVLVDIVIYVLTYRKALEIGCEGDPRSRSDEGQLFLVVKKLKVYPLIFAIAWLPRVIAIADEIITGKKGPVLWALSAICISSSGTAVGAHYFRHQRTFPDLDVLYLWTTGRESGWGIASSMLFSSSFSASESNISPESTQNSEYVMNSLRKSNQFSD